MSSTLGDAITLPAERRRLSAELHIRLHQYSEAAEVLLEVLNDDPDQWADLCRYLDCLLPQTSQNGGSSSSEPAGINRCLKFGVYLSRIIASASIVEARLIGHRLDAVLYSVLC